MKNRNFTCIAAICFILAGCPAGIDIPSPDMLPNDCMEGAIGPVEFVSTNDIDSESNENTFENVAELVDLDHPGDDRSARALPDDAGGEAGRKPQCAEEGEPPAARLDSG